MDPIAERIARLLPAMQTPSPPTARTSTPLPSIIFPGFRTFKDPVLETMGRATADFQREITDKAPARWLTLWGPPDVGKTMLARAVYRMHVRAIMWLEWTNYCRLYQSRDDSVSRTMARAIETPILFIDDIGAEHTTPATIGALHGLLQMRLGKFTMITSNLSVADWEERDARISSRMIRGGNLHVDCTTVPFSTRPK